LDHRLPQDGGNGRFSIAGCRLPMDSGKSCRATFSIVNRQSAMKTAIRDVRTPPRNRGGGSVESKGLTRRRSGESLLGAERFCLACPQPFEVRRLTAGLVATEGRARESLFKRGAWRNGLPGQRQRDQDHRGRSGQVGSAQCWRRFVPRPSRTPTCLWRVFTPTLAPPSALVAATLIPSSGLIDSHNILNVL
jgi:hypothetical protein